MKKIFYGRIPLENATSLLLFQKKGITQQLLHNLKYRGQQEIGTFLGTWLGSELAEHPDYKGVDLVIPVPLHRKKRRIRGYNQVSHFAIEIANKLGADYSESILQKKTGTRSQVFKNRLTRSQTHQIFELRETDLLKGKHVLVVDDIVTTGATLENCALALIKNGDVRVSFATMAMA
ncbi:ComF family protein [Pukyongia salina]|nr:phosphoribosyltransferase family protein [Pukyongia salina]